MILILIGIVLLITVIWLFTKIANNYINKQKDSTAIIGALLIFLGMPIAGIIILYGIFYPTKMSEWEVKESITPTLLNDEENILGGYTYEYTPGGSRKIDYEVAYLFQNVPILLECERKAEPTIWTLGLRYKETKYVFYSPDDTIN